LQLYSKKIIYYLLVFVASVLFCLLLLEAYLRFVPQNSSLKRDFSVHNLEFDYTVHLNQNYFRDDEFYPQKNPNVFRIFLIGDSFVYGAGVSSNQTLDRLLEEKLNQASEFKHYEVFNLGVVASDPQDYYEVAKQFQSYQADAVIVSFYVDNDIMSGKLSNRLKLFRWKSEIGDRIDSLLWKKGYAPCLFRWIPAYRRRVAPFLYEEACSGKINPHLLIRADEDQLKHYQKMLQLFKEDAFTRDYLLRIKKLYPSLPFLILLQPSKYQVNSDYFEDLALLGFNFPNHQLLDRSIQDSILAWGQQNSVEVIDVLPAMLKASDKNFYHRLDDHYNSRGNEFVAEWLAEYLETHIQAH